MYRTNDAYDFGTRFKQNTLTKTNMTWTGVVEQRNNTNDAVLYYRFYQ